MSKVRSALGRSRRALRAGMRELERRVPETVPETLTDTPGPAPRPSPRGVTLSDGRIMCEHPVASHMIVDGYCLLVTPRILFRDYEPAVTTFLRDAVQPGDIVVEVGANQGFHTLTLGMSVAPAGHVWAFEPHPRSRRILMENIASTGLHHNVTVIDAAAWSSEGEQSFRARSGEAAGSYLPAAFPIPYDRIEGEDLIVRTVDFGAFLAGLPAPPHLIKVDAEGSEETIMRSAADFLRAHHPTVVLELLPSAFSPPDEPDELDDLDDLGRWLRDLGYEIAYIEHFGVAPLESGAFRALKHGVEVVLWVPGGRGALRC